MAYTGRNPLGNQSIDINNSRGYQNHWRGPKPEGPWWQKLLATVIAILVFVGLLALVSGGEIFKIFTDIIK